DLVPDCVDEVVDPGDPLVVGPGQPGQPQGRPLHRDGGVAAGQVHDGPAEPGRQPAGLADRRAVQLQPWRWRRTGGGGRGLGTVLARSHAYASTGSGSSMPSGASARPLTAPPSWTRAPCWATRVLNSARTRG